MGDYDIAVDDHAAIFKHQKTSKSIQVYLLFTGKETGKTQLFLKFHG